MNDGWSNCLPGCMGIFMVSAINLIWISLSCLFDRVWFVDRHEYWARDCHFEMSMRTNRRLTKTFVG